MLKGRKVMEQLLCPNCTGAFDVSTDLTRNGFLHCSYCNTTSSYNNVPDVNDKLNEWISKREHQFVVALSDFIHESTDADELKTLIDLLNADEDFPTTVRYDNLSGDRHKTKCRELVALCRRQIALEDLFRVVLKFRPMVWEIVA